MPLFLLRTLKGRPRCLPGAVLSLSGSRWRAGVSQQYAACRRLWKLAEALVKSAVIERIGFDRLLCAIGRQARLDGFGSRSSAFPTGRTIEKLTPPADAYTQHYYADRGCGRALP